MSLFDFFFPEQAQAAHLRRIADQNTARRRQRKRAPLPNPLEERIATLEEDVGYLALMLGALLEKADEKGVLSREEIKTTLKELDEVDGVADGKLDIAVLRGLGR